MIKIGSVTIDVSHPISFSAKLIQNDKGMRYVGVYNNGFRSKEEVEKFANDSGAKIYDNIDQMVDEVDIGFIHSCNWDKHLEDAMPFINKGKPVFIDKPLVGNTKDLAKYRELVNAGANILGTSMLRYGPEVQEIRKEFAEKGIRALNTVVTVGVDEFNYAIHAVELICAIHHPARPLSTKHYGTTTADGQTIQHYFVKFDDNSTAEYICGSPRFGKFNTIVTTNGSPADDKCFQVDAGRLGLAMLEQVELKLIGEPSLITTADRTEEAIRIMLAGKASLENGDVEVGVYDALVDNTSFDGYAFETGYAQAAGYKDYVAERR